MGKVCRGVKLTADGIKHVHGCKTIVRLQADIPNDQGTSNILDFSANLSKTRRATVAASLVNVKNSKPEGFRLIEVVERTMSADGLPKDAGGLGSSDLPFLVHLLRIMKAESLLTLAGTSELNTIIYNFNDQDRLQQLYCVWILPSTRQSWTEHYVLALWDRYVTSSSATFQAHIASEVIKLPCHRKSTRERRKPWLKHKSAPGSKTGGAVQKSSVPRKRAEEPETALPVSQRLFSRFKIEVEESNCRALFKLEFREGTREAVVAASGTRKHATGHWKYRSEESFLNSGGQPWAGVPLKAFENATARAGVIAWLKWIIQHASSSLQGEE